MGYQAYAEYKESGIKWFKAIPSGWTVHRLKMLASEPLKYGANEAADLEDPSLPRFIRITDVNSDGSLNPDTFKSLPEKTAEPFLLEDGDILLARSGATVGKSFIYSPAWGKAAYAGYLIRLRTNQNVLHKRFAYYFFQSSSYWANIDSELIQATIQNFSAEKYSAIWIPTPCIDNQVTIAQFLDHKSAQIDSLIEKKQELIEKLQEQRITVITQALTKGLDGGVALRDSGIKWLGDVPAHWDIWRLRFSATMSGGMTPSTSAPQYWEGLIPWVTPKDMKSDRITSSIDTLTDLALAETSLQLYAPSQVLIVVRGMILAHTFPVGVNDVDVTVNQDMKVLSTTLNSEYLAILLRGFQNVVLSIVEESAHGTKVLRTDLFKNIQLPVPPINEQEAIVAYADSVIAKSDSRIEAVNTAIARLQEYRTALITAAVTGQIDVRDWQAPDVSKQSAQGKEVA